MFYNITDIGSKRKIKCIFLSISITTFLSEIFGDIDFDLLVGTEKIRIPLL